MGRHALRHLTEAHNWHLDNLIASLKEAFVFVFVFFFFFFFFVVVVVIVVGLLCHFISGSVKVFFWRSS